MTYIFILLVFAGLGIRSAWKERSPLLRRTLLVLYIVMGAFVSLAAFYHNGMIAMVFGGMAIAAASLIWLLHVRSLGKTKGCSLASTDNGLANNDRIYDPGFYDELIELSFIPCRNGKN